MAGRLRTKQVITFQATHEKLPVGILTVGESITQAQFDQIKDNPRFCEVLDEGKPKAKPRKVKPKVEPVVEPAVDPVPGFTEE